MKRSFCATCLIMLLFAIEGRSQGSLLEDGFSLKFSVGFPPSQYGFDGELPLPKELELETTFGLEIGNQWYFYNSGHFGVGLDINWFDVVYGRAKLNNPLTGTINRITLEGSFIEFGPVATYAINDLFAIEGYYNLRPTYMVTYYWENTDDYVLVRNFNFLHGFGIGVRLKFFYIGYEATFGNIDGNVSADGEFEDFELLFDEQRMSGSNSKLIIGFQF
ncbi:MAG: hypothetical protein MI975_15635 [Cytophagales bacterium]|nr:hypothetical protein [Cytophagales bacterium]